MTASAQLAPRCTGEPVSWLRLERWALAPDAGGVHARERAEIDAHLAECPACRACADEVRADVVVLVPLALPDGSRATPTRAWWTWLVPAFGIVVAAAIILLVMKPHTDTMSPLGSEAIARIKGVGTVTLGLVRERDGAIRDDVTTYAATDRWKLVVTCPPGAAAWIDVSVTDASNVPDYPLAPAHVACGNRVVVPGAFTITGSGSDRVCAYISSDAAPTRGPDRNTACVTLTPEPRSP